MHLASPRSLLICCLLSACAVPKVLGESPDTDADSSGAVHTTGHDPSGVSDGPTTTAADVSGEPATSIGSDTVATSGTTGTSADTVATSSPATGDSTGDPPGPLCSNPKHTCTIPIDCEAQNCGALHSPFDADGCLRRGCEDEPCGPGEVCYQNMGGGCFPQVTDCFDDRGTCTCTINDDCGGKYCYPEGEAPPAQCDAFTDEAACLAAGCSAFETVSTLTREGDECVCGEPLPACLWFFGAISGDDAPAPFYNQNSQQVVVFSTSWDEPPQGWAPCVGDPSEPAACSCASIGDDPCT